MGHKKVQIFRGRPEEVGFAVGQSVGDRFADNIDAMIDALDGVYGLDFEKLEKGAARWLERLPEDYQREIAGISRGSGCPVEKIARWYYSSSCTAGGCTGFIVEVDGFCWVGRNNDYLLPGYWDYVNIIEREGRIPVMLFGLEGDIFTGTGFNQEKMWIHYNWLPVPDGAQDKQGMSEKKERLDPYVFIRRALERAASISDVETLLQETVRDGGMNLFVVDGKVNEYAVFECTCLNHKQRKKRGAYIAAANHYCEMDFPAGAGPDRQPSLGRQSRVERLLEEKPWAADGFKKIGVEKAVQEILADPGVEQRGSLTGTVYSNAACPGKELIWFAADGFPAASRSSWKQVNWNW